MASGSRSVSTVVGGLRVGLMSISRCTMATDSSLRTQTHQAQPNTMDVPSDSRAAPHRLIPSSRLYCGAVHLLNFRPFESALQGDYRNHAAHAQLPNVYSATKSRNPTQPAAARSRYPVHEHGNGAPINNRQRRGVLKFEVEQRVAVSSPTCDGVAVSRGAAAEKPRVGRVCCVGAVRA
jgi:hypothetical protein